MEDDTVAASPDELALGPTELTDTPETVGDDHDHAEGRGLPVARLVAGIITPTEVLGNATAGWGLVPPGAVVWFRSLAELTAAGAGWTRETTLDGRYPIGAGTTGTQTFAAGTAYGSTWAHNHGDDHTHTTAGHDHDLGGHLHAIGSHTHTMKNHTHAGGPHTHTMKNHTHPAGSHTHTMKNHVHPVANHFHSLNGHSHTQPLHQHALGNAPNMTGGTAGGLMLTLGSATDTAGNEATGTPSTPDTSTHTTLATTAPNDNTSDTSPGTTGVPNDNTSDLSPGNTGTPNDNTSDGNAGYNTGTPSARSEVAGGLPTNSKQVAGFGGQTSDTSWIPPSMAGCFGRKL